MPPSDQDFARNRAARLLATLEADLAAGRIDEAEWYRRVQAVITPAYLAATTPWEQSGRSGDAESFEAARSLIADAFDRPGTFLDVGCASGYLMERVVEWGNRRGLAIDPWGLDIAPELVALARARLPHWSDRFFIGNALYWLPPRRFDYVRTGVEYVPRRRQPDLLAHLLEHVVADGGRLIVGTSNVDADHDEIAEQIAAWGFKIAGQSHRQHRNPRLRYAILWIDRPVPNTQ